MEVVYCGGLRTKAVHLKSGVEIITDAPTDNNGKGESFSPTDLASCSLASCMMTIIGIMAQNHGFDINGTKAEVTKVMSSDPRKIAEVRIRLIFPENMNADEKRKTMIKRAAHALGIQSVRCGVLQYQSGANIGLLLARRNIFSVGRTFLFWLARRKCSNYQGYYSYECDFFHVVFKG